MGAITAAATILDIAVPDGANLLTIPVLVAQYYILRRLIDRQGLRSADRLGGFGWFFVVGLVTGLGILLGFASLVLPGIYLYARWSVAGIALIAENRGANDAIGRSWEATRDHALPIALAWLTINLPFIASMVVLFATAAAAGPDASISQATGIGLGAILNLLLYASQVAGWYFTVALYELLTGPVDVRLGEVFA